MATIHMFEQVVDFKGNSPLSPEFFNKLTTQSSIIFPSNIIDCSLTVKDFSISNASLSTKSGISISNDEDTMSSIGWGVEDWNYIGNKVFFTGWMQLLRFNSKNKNVPYPQDSYLTVLAIAQCE